MNKILPVAKIHNRPDSKNQRKPLVFDYKHFKEIQHVTFKKELDFEKYVFKTYSIYF